MAQKHNKTEVLLALATAGLRDLHVGFPESEIASSNGVGLDCLLRELVGHLRSRGYDDEGGWDCEATKDIPVAQSFLHENTLGSAP